MVVVLLADIDKATIDSKKNLANLDIVDDCRNQLPAFNVSVIENGTEMTTSLSPFWMSAVFAAMRISSAVRLPQSAVLLILNCPMLPNCRSLLW